MDFVVNCIEPSKDVQYFAGLVSFGTNGGLATKDELDLKCFLPRGTIIRNSGKVLALVVYTGTDTKLILNFGKNKFKRPEFEHLLNKIMYIQAGIFVTSVAFLAIGNFIWNKHHENRHSYIFTGSPGSGMTSFKVFFSYWGLMLSLIPLEIEASI